MLLQRTQRPIEVQPANDGLIVRALLWPRYSNLTRWIHHQPRSHQVGQRAQVRRRALVPCDAHVVHCQRRADLPDFFVRLLSAYQVVDAEDDGQQVSRALSLDLHGRPEARVQGRRDPCRAKVGARVEVCKRFGALEADKLAEVACDVEVEERDEDGLPDGELLGEEAGDAAEDWRPVAVTSMPWSVLSLYKSVVVKLAGRDRRTKTTLRPTPGSCGTAPTDGPGHDRS